MLHNVVQRIIVKIFLVKKPCFWDKNFKACPLKIAKHTIWTFQEGCTWKEIWSIEILSWSRRLRFVKWLGTRLLTCWYQHTCCTKVFVNGVARVFTPWEQMYTWTMNYNAIDGIECSIFDWLVCKHNASFNERNWKL